MNTDILIRNIKLNVLSGIELKEPHKAIYVDLKNTFTDLNKYVAGENGHIFFYGKSTHDLYIYVHSLKKCSLNVLKILM